MGESTSRLAILRAILEQRLETKQASTRCPGGYNFPVGDVENPISSREHRHPGYDGHRVLPR